MAEWSKALALGASSKERGFEPHSCHFACGAAVHHQVAAGPPDEHKGNSSSLVVLARQRPLPLPYPKLQPTWLVFCSYGGEQG